MLKTKFAVRSDGRSRSPGFTDIGPEDVLIALQKLNALSLSPDKSTMPIGTENRWGKVYSYAARKMMSTLLVIVFPWSVLKISYWEVISSCHVVALDSLGM